MLSVKVEINRIDALKESFRLDLLDHLDVVVNSAGREAGRLGLTIRKRFLATCRRGDQ
jgi:hypothetical protein